MDGFDISTLFKARSCSPCLICGEIVEEYEEMRPAVPIICEECKRAVAWARKKSGKRKEGKHNADGKKTVSGGLGTDRF